MGLLLWLAACSSSHPGTGDDDDSDERSDAAASEGRGGADGGQSARRDGGGPVPVAADGGGNRDDGGGGAGPARPHVEARDAGSCAQDPSCTDGAPTRDCASVTLAAVEPSAGSGDVLLVFDRSASMNDSWNDMSRWQAAGSAVQTALGPLADRLTVGALFFPSPDPNATPVCVDSTGIACTFVPQLVLPPGECSVSPIAAADQLAFRAGDEFLTAFAGTAGTAPPYAPVPQGLTPLLEALQQAKTDLAAAALAGNVSVIIITDGMPNCTWDAAAAQQIASDWLGQGIQTHVIGLPGSDTTSASTLSDLASAGGTTAVNATNAAALTAQLSARLATSAGAGLDCAYELSPAAPAGEDVQLVVTQDGTRYDVAHELGGRTAWTLAADGTAIELKGALCTAAQQGRYESIAVELGCADLPDLPAP